MHKTSGKIGFSCFGHGYDTQFMQHKAQWWNYFRYQTSNAWRCASQFARNIKSTTATTIGQNLEFKSITWVRFNFPPTSRTLTLERSFATADSGQWVALRTWKHYFGHYTSLRDKALNLAFIQHKCYYSPTFLFNLKIQMNLAQQNKQTHLSR